jgi:hypothetical protein
VLLYELLTGTMPLTRQRLKDAALMEALRLIREEEPLKPSTRLSESKDSLASVSAQRHLEPAGLLKAVRGDVPRKKRWRNVMKKRQLLSRRRRQRKPSGRPRTPKQCKIRLSEALERLVQPYQATGNKEQVDKWRQVLKDQKNAASRAK